MANDPQNNLLVAQGVNAPYAAANLLGGHWNTLSAAATPLVVIPTTLCILELYNNPSQQMVMEIIDLFIFELLGTAAAHNVSLWACVTPPKTAAPTASGLTIGSQSGRSPYVSAAGTRVVTAAGTTIVANGWRAWGPVNLPATEAALPGPAWSVPVDGKLTVPPGCSLAVTAVDQLATASSVQVGAAWLEKALAAGENVS